MSDRAKAFLDEWVQSYVLAEPRSEDEAQETVDECIEDAAEDGITKQELQDAADGNLLAYIRRAIRAASDEI